ncbi:MAG TPA: DUF4389 domain-containing protein [Alphaproteobacteria bacterium]|jgi:hypothetical protein|nr:DUF4389 domain-containing protein [Alphaproteobacteria bacterium]MDP7427231.1 DUF4389 domain-containing protein [Alphaproteobacteria bacterium]HJM50102.1 DUF4389 domain-containing protein [Alphaproteobacteria bacterium]|tara:strand:- start:321 stop:644 length:324 start_codon:yes stop_codon:yes gene_type:complete
MTFDADTKKHVSEGGTWLRLVYMLLFVIIFNVAELVLGAVVVLQFLFKLFTGKAIEQLESLGQSLASYFYQMVLFLTFKTEDMPYPFGPWPKEAPEPPQQGRQQERR